MGSADRELGPGLRRAAAVAVAAFALLVPAAAAKAALAYAALGDSVASGYGLPGSGGACERSPRAYPERVRASLRRRNGPIRFTFLACSGATAAADRSGPRALATQVDRALAALGNRRALVSITIGINDLEWWNPIRLAVLLRASDADFDEWLDEAVGTVRRAVERELDRLLARPRIRVVLTDYFDPFNRRSPLFLESPVCAEPERCRSRVREAVDRVSAGLRRAAASSRAPGRVRVARAGARFVGHEAPRPLCGTAPPDPSASYIQSDCFHPNERGAAAIARAVDHAARKLGL